MSCIAISIRIQQCSIMLRGFAPTGGRARDGEWEAEAEVAGAVELDLAGVLPRDARRGLRHHDAQRREHRPSPVDQLRLPEPLQTKHLNSSPAGTESEKTLDRRHSRHYSELRL